MWVEERGGRLQPNVFHCFTAGGVVRVWGGGWRQALGRVSSWSSCSHTHSHIEHRAGGGGGGGDGENTRALLTLYRFIVLFISRSASVSVKARYLKICSDLFTVQS